MDVTDEVKKEHKKFREMIYEFVRSRSQAYQYVFDDERVDAKIVLKDLANFCRANQSTFHKDPRAHAVAEGRREVWLRIQQHLNLTPKQLQELYRKD